MFHKRDVRNVQPDPSNDEINLSTCCKSQAVKFPVKLACVRRLFADPYRDLVLRRISLARCRGRQVRMYVKGEVNHFGGDDKFRRAGKRGPETEDMRSADLSRQNDLCLTKPIDFRLLLHIRRACLMTTCPLLLGLQHAATVTSLRNTFKKVL